jgi:hypothetical protein
MKAQTCEPQHWRAFRSISGAKTTPVLAFNIIGTGFEIWTQELVSHWKRDALHFSERPDFGIVMTYRAQFPYPLIEGWAWRSINRIFWV